MNQELLNFIQKYKTLVDEEIARELDKRMRDVEKISPHLNKILSAMKELSSGGKRLRALLTILGWQIARARQASPLQDEDQIVRVGMMMEIFHLGLLIQDDFMDNDVLRRGVKTIIARYDDRHTGNFVSMLAGDYTFGWGIEILSDLKMEPSLVLSAMKVWGRFFTRVGYGQTLDGLAIADEKTIRQILELKSGEYSCVLPLLIGATLGRANEEMIEKLEKFGMELGYVFQLRDDWLGEYGDPEKTGKPVGNDSREGKHTYATMHGKEETEAAIKEHMELASNWGLTLQGQSPQGRILAELVTWMGTREN